MKPGDVFHITPGPAPDDRLEDCDLVEVSTPELDDVVRLEDRYGRADSEPCSHEAAHVLESDCSAQQPRLAAVDPHVRIVNLGQEDLASSSTGVVAHEGVEGAPTRRTGASRYSKSSSAMRAAISAP